MGAVVRGTVGALAVALLAVVTAGCGDDAPPPLTIEERLVLVAGRDLTTAELNSQLELGDLLCGMTEEVLDATWLRLDDEQLAFQDVVFGHICPERAVLYAGSTGRYVTDEAIESGVSTSTTRPTSTVADTTTSSSRSSQNSTTTDPSSPTTGDDAEQPRATIGPALDSSSTETTATATSSTTSTVDPSIASTLPDRVTTSVRAPTRP